MKKYLLALLFIISTILSMSCRHSRDLAKDSSNTDSLVAHVRDSMKQVENNLKIKHQSEVEEAKKTSIVFKDTPCPPCPAITIDSKCDSSQLVRAIRELEAQLKDRDNRLKDTKSKMRLLANGTLEIEGDLQQVNLELLNKQRTVTELDMSNKMLEYSRDSLAIELQKERESKKVKSSTKVLPGLSIALILVALVTGYLLCYKYHNKIFKSKTTST